LDRGKSIEGDIHCLLGWVGALARPSPAIFRNYRSVNPGITMTALGHSRPRRSMPTIVHVSFTPKADKIAGVSVYPLGADFVAKVVDGPEEQ
jgi:hypothetical protein